MSRHDISAKSNQLDGGEAWGDARWWIEVVAGVDRAREYTLEGQYSMGRCYIAWWSEEWGVKWAVYDMYMKPAFMDDRPRSYHTHINNRPH